MESEKFILWLWLFFVSLVGGVLGFLRKGVPCGSWRASWRVFGVGVLSSMFAAYIVFTLAFHYIQNVEVAVALAGVAAWMGADALIALEQVILDFISRGRK